MSSRIYADHVASISKFKDNPNKILADAHGQTIAVLANNEPRFYMVPPREYERMMELLEQLKPNSERVLVDHGPIASDQRLEDIADSLPAALEKVRGKKGGFAEINDNGDVVLSGPTSTG